MTMAGEFDFEPLSEADMLWMTDTTAHEEVAGETVRRMARELRDSRVAPRKVVEASCTDEEIAAMKTARALVAHVGGGGE